MHKKERSELTDNMIDSQAEALPCPDWLDIVGPHHLIVFGCHIDWNYPSEQILN